MLVPMRAQGRVIGALTLISSESRRLFEQRDLGFATVLALRIAVAVDNARLFGEATRARAAAEAMAQEVLEQSRAVEAALIDLRRERDEALARGKDR
jgi:GAF domain-containing protein